MSKKVKQVQYAAAALLFILIIVSYFALMQEPDMLNANIFFGNKGKTAYEKSGIKKKVEIRIFQDSFVTGVIASDGAYLNRVQITWNKLKSKTLKAEKYYIYRSTSANGTYIDIGNTASLLYDDIPVSPGIIYYYKIKAFNSIAGFNKFSSADSGSSLVPFPRVRIISGPTNDMRTNQAFTITLNADKDFGYWSTNSGPFNQFSAGNTIIPINTTSTLKYYGDDGLNTSSTQTVVYTVNTNRTLIVNVNYTGG